MKTKYIYLISVLVGALSYLFSLYFTKGVLEFFLAFLWWIVGTVLITKRFYFSDAYKRYEACVYFPVVIGGMILTTCSVLYTMMKIFLLPGMTHN